MPAISRELLILDRSSLKPEQHRDAVSEGSCMGVQLTRGAERDPACEGVRVWG